MSHNKREIGSSVIFFLTAVALYAGSYAIVVTTNNAMGPQFLPRTVAICMGILIATQVTSGLKKERKEQGSGERSDFSIRAVVTIGIFFTYALLVQTVGFIIMIAVHLLAQIPLLLPRECLRSGKGILITVAVSVATSVLIYKSFYRAFNIFLPTGLLG